MRNKLISSLLLLLIGLSFGCKKDQGSLATTDETITAKQQVTPIAYNPYSLENMRKAAASLLMKDVQLLTNNQAKYAHGKILFSNHAAELTIDKSLTAKESSKLAEKELLATHYYIKFMPANEADLAKLKADTNLMIYPFPLDAAVSKYNGSYRDPSLPAGVPTYQYASVPVTKVLPSVPFVKLADLYLPDERTNAKPITIKGAGNSSYSVSGRELVNESMCGGEGGGNPDEDPVEEEVNEEEECDYGGGGPSTGTGAPAGEWRPSGRITMNDDVLGVIGVEGIKVRARRWFTTYTGLTDANGYYHVDGTYTRPANYWLNFERHDFAIIDFVHQATYEVSGPKQQAAWNVNFTGYNRYYATIFRAAFHYYHKDIQGLRRPPQSSFWERQLKITAVNSTYSTSGTTNPTHTWFGINDLVTIISLDNSSDYTYATTIHELAHASHWDESNWSFAMSAQTVSESMAAGVEWALTKMVYPDFKGYEWPLGGNYRNVVMDLIDNSSEISYYDRALYSGNYNNFGFGAPKDQVEGYSILQIQNAMIHNATTWNEWKNNIINNYNNGTEQHVETLFNHWLNY